MTEKRTGTTRDERSLERSGASTRSASPFRVLERFADEMDRVFDDFGFGRTWGSPALGRQWLRQPWGGTSYGQQMWSPEIEIFHRNSELVIRADLPGLTKDEVKVEITEGGVTIEGERQRRHEEEHEGVYRSERSYGSFYRAIPLPEGVIADQAKATFKDGVLEITMPAPPEQARRGRRLEISEGAPGKR
jgi:HSP20 family protein